MSPRSTRPSPSRPEPGSACSASTWPSASPSARSGSPGRTSDDSCPMKTPRGLFAGLCTLDIVQLVDHVPGDDEKVTARRQTVAAGGPATNAAVTFAHLGGRATLLSAVGGHPLAAGIRADLERMGVELVNLATDDEGPPAVSAIMVTARTGARAVVSADGGGRTVRPPDRKS